MTNRPPISPSLPFKTRLGVAAISAITDASRRSDGSINRRLLNLVDIKASASPKPINNVRTADLTINAHLRLRLFVPTAAGGDGGNLPLIVFFHGGGFAYLSAFSTPFDVLCRRLARDIEAVVASVEYRLSPEHRFPAQYDDGVSALRFIADGGLAASAHIHLSSTFLIGDCAGGNIAHNVALRWAAAKEFHPLHIRGMVAIQPCFGGEERTPAELRLAGAPLGSVELTDWLWRAFLPEGEDRDHEAANVFGPRGVAELPQGFPAVAVVVGGYDPLQDWQRRYYEGLRERGGKARLVEFPDAFRTFYAFPELPETGKLVEELKEFVGKHRSSASE